MIKHRILSYILLFIAFIVGIAMLVAIMNNHLILFIIFLGAMFYTLAKAIEYYNLDD